MTALKNKIKNIVLKIRYKLRNPNSLTYINRTYGLVKLENISCGKYSYGPLNIYTFTDSDGKIIIGNFVSIADEVVFLTGGDHKYDSILTYPVQRKIFRGNYEAISKGNIIIEDDVWIGFGVTILSGVTLHRGCVIGARAVVTKDIPAYAIAVGSPAKVIKYRFDNVVVEKLNSIAYSELSYAQLQSLSTFNSVTSENVDEIIKIIKQTD